MSIDSAFAFMEVVRTQPDLQARIRELKATEFEHLVKVAVQKGFQPFTMEDYLVTARIIGGEWLTMAWVMAEEKRVFDDQ